MIPLRSDRRLRHTPWVNVGLIVANVVVFILQNASLAHAGAPDVGLSQVPWWEPYLLQPQSLAWYQYLTYQFLHADTMHLCFNMVFLYVFGNSVEDRIGHIGHLFFYLAGGVLAAVGHVALQADPSPMLGASGSVSAVTGAYLALFPLSNITILYFFFIIGVFEIPSLYLILFCFAQDLFFQFVGGGQVAYLAHISGSVYGFALGMALLATRILPREPYDFLALVHRWNRRRQFRALTSGGYQPWAGEVGGKVLADKSSALSPEQEQVLKQRARVMQALADNQPDGALREYQGLLELADDQVLPRDNQLDLANYAMSDGQYRAAAHAYEGFLRTYPRDSFKEEIHLILGLIYGRYLNQRDQAAPHLQIAAEKHDDRARRDIARQMLEELGG